MKILVLEDDALVAQGLVRGLAYLDCTGIHASDIGRAQQMVRSDAEIGIALIDIGLDHGQSGQDFFAWLEREYPGICRVLISGLPRPAAFVDDPPRQLFLHKPFGHRELVRLLAAVQSPRSTGGIGKPQ